MSKTGFACHESFFWHYAGSGALVLQAGGYVQNEGSSESPESKRRFKNLMEMSGLYKKLHLIEPVPATVEQVGYFHTKEHIDNVRALSGAGGGESGILAHVGVGSYEIAMLTVGAAIESVRAVVNGECTNAYALTRPPGHHAEAHQGNGYCIFNNAVIAARFAQKELGIKKILVLDWDVHHGNGIEDAFYDDDDVLFISLHQEGYYPAGRGLIKDAGRGKGEGFTINIPLYAGTGDAGFLYAYEQVVQPAVDKFKPELIIIAAGQDANFFDPLARMMVSADGFKQKALFMKALAEKHCNGKLVCLHEGGYSTAYVPFCTHAIMEGLSGEQTDVGDPFHVLLSGTPYKTLYDHQKARVDEIKAFHGI